MSIVYINTPGTGTLTHSTNKSKVFSSFKFTSSAEGAEDSKGGEDKEVLELTGCAVDDGDRRPSDYEAPATTGIVASTTFEEGSIKNEDELTGCAVEDDEERANAYDVPRSADAYDVPRPANAYDVPRPANAYDVLRPANAYHVPRPTTGATYYNI